MTQNELSNIYIKNLKNYRNEKNISQEKLSELAQISPSFLSDIENGKKWGSFETLVSLANALEIEPYELLLPNAQSVHYDTKRTRSLMKRLRGNVSQLLDTLEEYLGEWWQTRILNKTANNCISAICFQIQNLPPICNKLNRL